MYKRQELNKPENKEQLNSVLKGFGSEDEYWDYEYMVYQKQLPIQKYVKSLENDYNNAHQEMCIRDSGKMVRLKV